MWDNIGVKIKVLAKIIAWVGIISSVIGGISLISQGAELNQSSWGGSGGSILILSGFGTIIIGTIFSWIGSFFMYGFGELIENSQKQTKLQRQLLVHFGVSESMIEDVCKTEVQKTVESPSEINVNNEADSTGKIKLIIERANNDMYSGMKFDIFINNKKVFDVGNNTKTNYFIDSGTHTIFAKVENYMLNTESETIDFNSNTTLKLSVFGVGNIKLEK